MLGKTIMLEFLFKVFNNVLLLVILYRWIFQYSWNNKRRIYFLYILICGFLLSNFLFFSNHISNIQIILTIQLISAILLFQGYLKSRVFLCFPSFIIQSLIETLIDILICYCNSVSLKIFYEHFWWNIWVEWGMLLLYFLLGYLIRKNNWSLIKIKNNHTIFYIFLLFLSVGIFFIEGGIEFYSIYGGIEKLNRLMGIGISIVYLCFIFIIIILFKLYNINKINQENIKMNQRYLQIQKKYYEELAQKNEDIRRFRHDYRSHLEMIQHLEQHHQYHDLHKYMQDLLKVKKNDEQIYFTGNTIIDAIIYDMNRKTAAAGITLRYKGTLPKTLPFASIDLCTIFSNIFQNAFESCQRVNTESKIIFLDIKQYKSMLFIIVQNSSKSIQTNNKGELISYKRNNGKPGIGMKNIQDVVNRYHGSMSWTLKDNLFYMKIMIRSTS